MERRRKTAPRITESRLDPTAFDASPFTVSMYPNIDEFTETTSKAIEQVGGAKRGKAIIILNPAEPPLIMRDTVNVMTETAPDQAAITESVLKMVADVQTYVPGYKLKSGPVFDGNRVSVFLEVTGAAHYLPAYAGNLDIMTAAAVRVAEAVYERRSALVGAK